MICQQDLHVIHNHITRAQDFHFDWVYTIFTFFSTRGIAFSLFSSLSPLVLPFIYFFKNRGGKGVRTAAKSFLVQFQSILSRVSQNVKCNIPSGDSVGIVRDVRGNWEIQTSAVPLSAVMSPVDPSWSSSPGSWMCDLSWRPLLPSCPCQKEVCAMSPPRRCLPMTLPSSSLWSPLPWRSSESPSWDFFFLHCQPSWI